MGKTKTAFVSQEDKKGHKAKNLKPKADKVHIAGLKGGQRVKVIDVDLPTESPVSSQSTESVTNKSKKIIKQRIRGKKYLGAKSKIDTKKVYKVNEAVTLIKETSFSKFDGTVELSIITKKVGINVNVKLPFSAGKEKKVEIADDATINKLQEGKIDFDVLLATPEMMPKLVPFAKVLGPKGMMPNPKNGTLITDIKKAKDFSVATLNIKTEKEAPLIHIVVGKVSQKNKELEENITAVLIAITDKQIVKAYLKSSMSPSIKLTL